MSNMLQLQSYQICFASKLYSYKFIISVILYVWKNEYLCICN